ncbi:hypothetical protein G4B88_015279 [Cannabis sativa]|uniref:DUF4283 domain-containing protein n=1 Tax=Cannabis sativa TaxID=3483 RepID=A0A7J6E4H8_CANSA|nr:hypothetical protein G4B88_015279 [Cannabis sativa]
MASLFHPIKCMYVKELEHNRYIFQFYHDLDLKRVIDGSTWIFNKTQFVFAKLVPGVDPRAMIINHLDMWVQVHGADDEAFNVDNSSDQQPGVNGEIPTITNASHPNLVQRRKETNMAAGVREIKSLFLLFLLVIRLQWTAGFGLWRIRGNLNPVDSFSPNRSTFIFSANLNSKKRKRKKQSHKTKPDRDEDQPTDEERDEVDDEADRATTNSPTNPMKTNMKHTDVEEEELDRQWEMLPLHFVCACGCARRWFDECDPTHLANMGKSSCSNGVKDSMSKTGGGAAGYSRAQTERRR